MAVVISLIGYFLRRSLVVRSLYVSVHASIDEDSLIRLESSPLMTARLMAFGWALFQWM